MGAMSVSADGGVLGNGRMSVTDAVCSVLVVVSLSASLVSCNPRIHSTSIQLAGNDSNCQRRKPAPIIRIPMKTIMSNG